MNNIDTSKVVVIVYLRLYSTGKKLPDTIVFKEKLFPHHHMFEYMVPTATFFVYVCLMLSNSSLDQLSHLFGSL